MKQKHGGNREKYIREYGRNLLDFSASVNPFGASGAVREEVGKLADRISDYPDPDCTELKKAIEGYTGLSADMVSCGNGGSDLIMRTAGIFAGKKVLLPVPSFGEYEEYPDQTGCRITKYRLTEEGHFRIHEDILGRIKGDTGLLILTEPNNPTGLLTDMSLKERIIKKCEETGTFLLIDESFIEFSDDPGGSSMLNYVRESDRLIILRAFTKFFGLAGLRLGYIISSNSLIISKYEQLCPEWNISIIAQRAGIRAIEDIKTYKEELVYINWEKEYLSQSLNKAGYKVFDSQADFIFFKGRPGLADELAREGIVIRDCSSFDGLDKGWYRIGIRLHEDNKRLAESGVLKKYGFEKS